MSDSDESAARKAVRDHYSGFMVAGHSDGGRACTIKSFEKVTDGHYRYKVKTRNRGDDPKDYTGTVYKEDGDWEVDEDH